MRAAKRSSPRTVGSIFTMNVCEIKKIKQKQKKNPGHSNFSYKPFYLLWENSRSAEEHTVSLRIKLRLAYYGLKDNYSNKWFYKYPSEKKSPASYHAFIFAF